MAIKGKKRSRGGTRRITTAPPRPPVPGHTPLVRRTGFRIAMAVLLLAVGLVLFFVIRAQLREERAREAAQEDVREFQVRVEAAITSNGVGQTGFGAPLLLSELGASISQLGTEELKPAEVREKATGWNEDARAAADAIAALDVGTGPQATELAQAKTLLQQGLVLHAQLASALDAALDVEGEAATKLAGIMTEQLGTATTVFSAGWDRLQQVRTSLGIEETPPPGAVPPGGGIPGAPGVPGVPGLPTG